MLCNFVFIVLLIYLLSLNYLKRLNGIRILVQVKRKRVLIYEVLQNAKINL